MHCGRWRRSGGASAGGPPVQLHQVALGAAAVETGIAEVMPEPMREYLDAALASPPGDDLADAAGGHRAAVTDAEPELRPVRLGLPGADPEVPVEGASGVVADLDGPGLAALAVDGDLPVPQVEVAAPRVVGVIADARQADARPSGRPAGGSRAACLACANAERPRPPWASRHIRAGPVSRTNAGLRTGMRPQNRRRRVKL